MSGFFPFFSKNPKIKRDVLTNQRSSWGRRGHLPSETSNVELLLNRNISQHVNMLKYVNIYIYSTVYVWLCFLSIIMLFYDMWLKTYNCYVSLWHVVENVVAYQNILHWVMRLHCIPIHQTILLNINYHTLQQTISCSTILYSTLLYSTILYCTILY